METCPAASAATTLCTHPCTSLPMCSFMPKYHALPFLICFISGSHCLSWSFLELGALMILDPGTTPSRLSDATSISVSVTHPRVVSPPSQPETSLYESSSSHAQRTGPLKIRLFHRNTLQGLLLHIISFNRDLIRAY